MKELNGEITAAEFAPDGETRGKPLSSGTVKVFVSVVDVSIADKACTYLGRVELTADSFPIKYQASYDDEPIHKLPRGSYAVQVSIEIDGKLAYVNDTRHPFVAVTGENPDGSDKYTVAETRDVRVVPVIHFSFS